MTSQIQHHTSKIAPEGHLGAVSFAIIVFLLLAYTVVGINYASAQESEEKPFMLMSWTADTYIPDGYRGRALPIANSDVTVTLDVIDKGKRVDISKYEVRWSLGDNPLVGDLGRDRISIKIPDVSTRGTYEVRAEIRKYNNATLIKYLKIPVELPKIAIPVLYTGGRMSSLSGQLQAIPYFFNISFLSRLTFDWTVNGFAPEGGEEAYADPDFLTLNINEDAAPGSMLIIKASARNLSRPSERASREIRLTYSP